MLAYIGSREILQEKTLKCFKTGIVSIELLFHFLSFTKICINFWNGILKPKQLNAQNAEDFHFTTNSTYWNWNWVKSFLITLWILKNGAWRLYFQRCSSNVLETTDLLDAASERTNLISISKRPSFTLTFSSNSITNTLQFFSRIISE